MTSTLTVGEAPVQAEVDLELPPDRSLRPIEDTLRARLGPAASAITVAPQRLSVRQDGMLVCRVQVRSPSPLEQALLAEALTLAVGRGEPVDTDRLRHIAFMIRGSPRPWPLHH